MVSRKLTVLLMGLIALNSLHLTYGVPIVDENTQDHAGKDKVAKIADEKDFKSVEAVNNVEKQAVSKMETPVAAEKTTSVDAASSISDILSLEPSSFLSALERAAVEYSPIEYAPDASTTFLNSIYEPLYFYPDLDSMYIERYARDASQSTQGLQNTYINPYAYGLAKLPDTQVLNDVACVEHHYTHLVPSTNSNKPQMGCFIKRKIYNNGLDKVCK